jgi:tetratricopeptide (TPR) repeat protein
MTTTICPMLSSLKPVDEQGRPVNRECILEGCRFFNKEQKDCNLMIGTRAMIRAAGDATARADSTKDFLKSSQALVVEVRQAGMTSQERLAALEKAFTELGSGLSRLATQIASVVESQKAMSGKLTEEVALLTASAAKTEQAVAALAPRVERADEAMRAIGQSHKSVLQALEARHERDRAENERRRKDDAVERNNKGVALYYRGAFDAALETFKKALELQPEYAEASNNLGLVLSKLGREKEAMEAFQRALTIDPRMAETYNNLGFLFHTKAQFERAAQMFGRAIENSSDSSVAYTNLGNTLYAMKQGEKAVEAWKRAIELDPLNENARRGLRMFQQDAPVN